MPASTKAKTNGVGVDIEALIAGAQRPERSVSLCLRGDLVAEHEELDRQRAQAQRDDDGSSLASGGAAKAIAERMRALEDEMRDSTVTVVLRALTRTAWTKLVDLYPPRKDDEGKVDPRDRLLGVNMSTFWGPLIKACWVTPGLDPKTLDHLLEDTLSFAQYDGLANAAWEVNRGDVDVPFSSAASELLRTSSTG